MAPGAPVAVRAAGGWAERVHLWLFPPACRLCDTWLTPPADIPPPGAAVGHGAGYPFLCETCLAALPWAEGGDRDGPQPGPATGAEPEPEHPPASVDRITAAFGYAPPVQGWIGSLKYARRDGWARPLAALMVAAPGVREALARADALVPVPLHPRRLRRRGFNQSLLLGHALLRLARRAGGHLPRLRADLLRRHRDTRPQVSMSGQERRTNVSGAFSLTPAAVGALPAGARVLLLDDVTTTGATLHACARALREGGAGRVEGLVLARAGLTADGGASPGS